MRQKHPLRFAAARARAWSTSTRRITWAAIAKKVRTVLPLHPTLIDQLEVGLVDERGGTEGMARCAPVGEVPTGRRGAIPGYSDFDEAGCARTPLRGSRRGAAP